MKVKFAKMTGAGNDFVVIDNRSRDIRNGPRVAKILCNRRWGIGADGLLLLEKSRRASYRMMYYNADGSYGGMCGNGGRCIAFYAFSARIAKRKHSFEALDYVYNVDVGKNVVVLSMKDPRRLKVDKKLRLGSRQVSVNFIDTGSPHVVIPVESLKGRRSLDELDVVGIGRTIRQHRDFAPAGTNVNFVERDGPNRIRMRTYERGVEDETLACGTGSIASAIVATHLWNMHSPVTVIPRSRVPLRVEFSEGRFISNVRLIGPAKVVYTGFVKL
jgi:diaminopimelate epimerase